MKNKAVTFLLLLSFLIPSQISWARWVWSPEQGKFVNAEGQTQDQAEEILQYANQFYRDGDKKEAIDQLKSVIEKYPSSRVAPDAQYKIGVIYEELGDLNKAYQAYKKLLTSYPQNRNYDEVVERLYKIGNAFLSGKKARLMGLEILPSLPKAIEVFKFLVEQAPFSQFGDKATFQLGLSYKKAGRYDDAMQSFQQLIDQHAKSELVPDARYQLAESSYLRSKSEYRDQRALDQASDEVQKFITNYPDANTTEEANKLKQAIDEKNAQKNFEIGQYYEKTNYLQSALIYYSDAAERYPDTKWGMKAKEKIGSLKEPTAYHTSKQKQINEEIQILQAKIKVVPESDAVQRDRLQRKIDLLNKRYKNLEKLEKENVSRIRDDLKRREGELKDKWKNLNKKKKGLAANQSSDLKAAMERWEGSLREEQDQLDKEKEQLASWREDLGIRENKFGLDRLPFFPEEVSDLEKVRSIEAKKLFKLSLERKNILEEKEVLYKQRGEVMTRVDQIHMDSGGEADEWMKDLDLQNASVVSKKEEIQKLESVLSEKKKLFEAKVDAFEQQTGQGKWEALYKAPVQAVGASTSKVAGKIQKSFDAMNPFSGSTEALESKSVQELAELQMHTKEKMVSQQNLVDTLSQAYDSQSALNEQKKMAKKLDVPETKQDPEILRKESKTLQKKIRALYQDIEDEDRAKAELLKKLDLLKKSYDQRTPASKAGHSITDPFVGTAKMMKAFIVGLPNKEVEITQSADQISKEPELYEQAKTLQQDIETKSLVIEAKSREIVQAKKELDILKAQSALESGLKFRSVLVDVPYEFIGEAIDNARKIVPKKDRGQVLESRIQDETKRLEELKASLKKLDQLISEKNQAAPSPAVPALPAVQAQKGNTPDQASLTQLKEEIEALRKEIDSLSEEIAHKKKELRGELKISGAKKKALKKQDKIEKKAENRLKEENGALRGELREIESNLQDMIHKETRLESEETQILEKRISAIDKVIPNMSSKSASQDLLREREHLESRLSEITLRRDFLSKEMERFQTSSETRKS